MNKTHCFLIAVFLAPIVNLDAQLQVHRGDSDRTASEAITVQNRFLRLVVNPGKGGVIQSFVYRGEELTRDEGILQDHLWDLGHGLGGFCQEPYLVDVKELPGSVVLHLWREGTKGNYQFVEIHKYITLSENESGVLVTYGFHNQVRSQTPITVFPWFNHILGTAGPNAYFIPTEEGVKRISYDPDHVDWGGEDPRANIWFNNPSRGWSGFVGKDHVGLVCLPEYRYLHRFYNWLGKNLATLEWRFIPVAIQPGSEFKTSFLIIPFKGLTEISGAGGGVVASLDRPNHRILLVSHRKQEVRARLRIKGPDGKEERRADVALTLEPGAVTSVPFGPTEKNSDLIYCEITDNQGKYLADVEEPLKEGETHALLPREPRLKPEEKEIPWEFHLSDEYPLPAFKWAKPYHYGKPKVLFILDLRDIRNVLEVSARADVDFKYSVHTGVEFYGFSPWIDPPARLDAEVLRKKSFAQLETLLNDDYNLIVFSDRFWRYAQSWLPWDYLPTKIRERIVAKVKGGTGLLLVHPANLSGELRDAVDRAVIPGPGHFLLTGFPFGAFSDLAASDIRIARMGEGRITILAYPSDGFIPRTIPRKYSFPYWEFHYSLFLKSLLWTAKSEPHAAIDNLTIAGDRCSLSFTDDERLAERCSFDIVSENGQWQKNWQAEIRSGENSFSLPGLPAGNHFLIVRTLDKQGRGLDFASTSFAVAKPTIIQSLLMDKEMYRTGEEITGKVVLSGDIPSNDSLQLRLSCIDNYGRLLFEQRVSPLKKTPFSFRIQRPLAVIHRLRAQLSEKGAVLSEKEATFYLPEVYQTRPYFILGLWGSYEECRPGFTYTEALKRVREIGDFNLMHDGTVWAIDEYAPLYAENNVRFAVENYWHLVISNPSPYYEYQKTRDKSHLIRKPCLTDPEYIARTRDRVSEFVRMTEKYGTIQYSGGDEMSLTTEGGDDPIDVCFSPTCLKGFRESLRKELGAIENLNQRWQTNYSSFEEIVPFTWQEALEKDNWSSYLYHRSYMDSVYADWFRLCSTTARAANPRAYAGESGIEPKMSAYGGYDWSKKMKELGVVRFYGLGDIPISFADRRQSYVGSWCLGYGEKEAKEQYDLWRALCHGQNYIGYWFLPLLINHDLSPTPYARFISPHLKEVRSGLGDLLGKAEYVYSPIAIHYSQRSCQISFLLSKSSPVDMYRVFKENVENWNQQLRKWGYTPRFVSGEQIESDGLRDFKVLVLPLSLSLSEQEARQIEQFVSRGGLLIADGLTGIYDEYGKRRSRGILDDLLGVRREKGNMLSYQPMTISTVGGGFVIGAAELGVSRARKGKVVGNAPGVKRTTFGGFTFWLEESLSPLPSLMLMDSGKGRSLYLGGGKLDFDYRANKGSFLLSLLQSQKVPPPVTIKESLPIEVGCFRDGEVKYYVVLPPDYAVRGLDLNATPMKKLISLKMKTTISFPHPGYLYEMRSKRDFGWGKEFKVEMTPAVGQVFALLPKRPNVRAVVPVTAQKGQLLKCRIDQKKINTDYPVRVEVISPAGHLLKHYSSVVFVPRSGLVHNLPLALNDSPGIYTLRFTDLIAGEVQEASFTRAGSGGA